MNIEVGQIVGFLERFAPARAEALRADHREAEAFLRASGTVLGTPADDAALAAAGALLDNVAGVAREALLDTAHRIRIGRRLEVLQSCLALFTSGGVLGALLGLDARRTAAAIALIGFAGSAVAIFVAWLRSPPIGTGTIVEKHAQLRDVVWEARTLAAAGAGLSTGDGAAVRAHVAAANALAGRATALLGDLDYHPDFRPA